MTISAWWLLPFVIPVLLLGEVIVRNVALLRRFSIPVPVVGGLIIALLVLAINLAGFKLSLTNQIGSHPLEKAWMWLSTPEISLGSRAKMNITEPLVVAFFTCIGLNASWFLAKKGGAPLIWFLIISAVLAASQNILGVVLCKVLDENPLMGVLTGGVALTGGPGTAMGMAPTFEKHGFQQATAVGLAAATFGLVGGSLLGGPVAALLIKVRNLQPATVNTLAPDVQRGFEVLPPEVEGKAAEVLAGDLAGETPSEQRATAVAAGDGEGFGAAPSGFIHEVVSLGRFGVSLLLHLGILLLCLKAGSWVSYYGQGLEVAGQAIPFPVYMGAMIVGILLRNVLDWCKIPVINPELIEALASVLLAVFLSVTMVTLNLMDLKSVGLSLTILLIAQVALMACFALFITFPLMGRNYDAAVLAAGQIGFGLGATSNAVATMEATTRRYGPSPKSFLIVTIVGGFLIDGVNICLTIGFLHWLT